jgi:hypothetical protein
VSGSPSIQDGKIVGAVTHVLINDPTTGYGIFIENMLAAAEMPMARAAQKDKKRFRKSFGTALHLPPLVLHWYQTYLGRIV